MQTQLMMLDGGTVKGYILKIKGSDVPPSLMLMLNTRIASASSALKEREIPQQGRHQNTALFLEGRTAEGLILMGHFHQNGPFWGGRATHNEVLPLFQPWTYVA